MKLPILVTIPHASSLIPAEIKKRVQLTNFELKYKIDAATDEIFGVKNAHVVVAKFSRVVGDPNGDPREFDEGNPEKNGAVSLRKLFGKSILRVNPSVTEVAAWRRRFVEPYLMRVAKLLPHVKFLLDGHSHLSRERDTGEARADIVISNHNFRTCGKVLTRKITEFFARKNFSVAVNEPFEGSYLLKKFCGEKRPPGVQIEVKRSLYLDEKNFRVRKKDVARLNKIIAELVEHVAAEI